VSAERLVFLADERALKTIRSQGLGPDDVKVMVAAAGGPRWLILGHLDRVLFGGWFDKHLPWRRPTAGNMADVLRVVFIGGG
jgi:hypothetical protein